MKGKEFVFDYVHLLYYKCHKINLNRGGSYIKYPDWIKNKKTTRNPVNKKYNKCFQYAVAVALNHEEIGKHAERITKIKPFINKYKWKGINLPSEKDDWKTFEKNNVRICLNVLYAKKEKNISCLLRWYHARDLFGSQIPVTTRGFELRISCIRSSYLTH